MNKIYFLVLSAIIIISSCSKKTDTVVASASITGKWILKSDTVTNYENGILKFTDTSDPAGTLQFNKDLSGTESFGNNNTPFTYKVNGKNVTMSFAATTTSDAFIETAAIKQLTDNKLVLYFDDSETNDNIVYRTTEIQYFSK